MLGQLPACLIRRHLLERCDQPLLQGVSLLLGAGRQVFESLSMSGPGSGLGPHVIDHPAPSIGLGVEGPAVARFKGDQRLQLGSGGGGFVWVIAEQELS